MPSLSTLVQRVRNTPGLFGDVTALTICVVMGLACSGYILSHQKFTPPWTDQFTFSAEFDKAPAVRPESLQEVRIAGVQVGRITDAAPTKTGLAKVTMSIDPNNRVYENARVVIQTKSPLNVMYATLDPGGPPAAPLKSGGVIPVTQTDRAIQPNEILDKLDAKARFGLTSLLNETNIAMASGPKNLGNSLNDTRDAMQSFQPVLDQLEQRRGNLKRLVTAFSGIARAAGEDNQRLAELTDASQKAIGALASRDDQLSAAIDQLPAFSTELRQSMTSVDALSTELNPTLDNLTAAANQLPGALKDLEGSVSAIHKFVNGASPVIDKAGPVVDDLTPFVSNALPSLRLLSPVTGYLPSATQRIVPWMDDLAAFVYQTSSSFSLYDANGGLGRANVNVDLTNPAGGLQDEGIPGHTGKRN